MRTLILFLLLGWLAAIQFVSAEQSHTDDDAFWADAAMLLPAWNGTPAEAGPSSEAGDWGPVIAWPHVPVSAASLPNGRILTFSSNERAHWPANNERTYSAIWDPATSQFVELTTLRTTCSVRTS